MDKNSDVIKLDSEQIRVLRIMQLSSPYPLVIGDESPMMNTVRSLDAISFSALFEIDILLWEKEAKKAIARMPYRVRANHEESLRMVLEIFKRRKSFYICHITDSGWQYLESIGQSARSIT